MAWTNISEIHAANAVGNSADAIEWTANQTLNPGELADIQVHCNEVGDTDNLNVYVRSSLGANDDTIPRYSYQHENSGTNGNSFSSFSLSGIYQFAVGVRSAGTTDLHVVDINMKTDGVDL